MSTAEVARDMDLLRRAVGDMKLTYLGFSFPPPDLASFGGKSLHGSVENLDHAELSAEAVVFEVGAGSGREVVEPAAAAVTPKAPRCNVAAKEGVQILLAGETFGSWCPQLITAGGETGGGTVEDVDGPAVLPCSGVSVDADGQVSGDAASEVTHRERGAEAVSPSTGLPLILGLAWLYS